MKTKKKRPALVIGVFLKKYIPFFLAAMLFSLLHTMANSFLPQVIRFVVDCVTGVEPEGNLIPMSWQNEILSRDIQWILGVLAAMILALAVLAGVFGYLSGILAVKASEKFVQDLRDKLFQHVQRVRFAWHSEHMTGDIIQRCTSDVDVIRGFVANQLMEVFRVVILITVSLIMMFSMDVQLTIVAVSFMPIVIGNSIFFYSRVGKRFLAADEAGGELSTVVQENLTGVRVVRAFGRERFEIERFDEKNNYYSEYWRKLGFNLSLYWSSGDFLTALQILIIVSLGAIAAVQGRITPSAFIAFIMYNASLLWPVRSLGRVLSEMSKAGVSMERVAYLLEAQEEKDRKSAKEPPMDRDIVFDHVSYGYEGEKDVVHDVSFTIPAGSTFGILGGTGSGKSTLIQLLNRLYELPPDKGNIRIGDVDVADIKLSYLRNNIGVVLQEPFLFSRTVRENIGITRKDADFSEVRHAASIASIDDTLDSFSDGYETMVGERGVTLSGGQKQRVAIARMLVQKAPVIVFDDSLSAVDAQTDLKIRTALRKNLKGATVILISHRISTLMHAEQILVLDQGKIAQQGSHRDLLKKEGIYKGIYEIQMNQADRRFFEKDIPTEQMPEVNA